MWDPLLKLLWNVSSRRIYKTLIKDWFFSYLIFLLFSIVTVQKCLLYAIKLGRPIPIFVQTKTSGRNIGTKFDRKSRIKELQILPLLSKGKNRNPKTIANQWLWLRKACIFKIKTSKNLFSIHLYSSFASFRALLYMTR